jgi:hypothetical protein
LLRCRSAAGGSGAGGKAAARFWPDREYIFRMSQRIAIECLSCGHCGSLAERELPRFGLAEDASLVLLTKRLVCQECGSRSVRAFRYDPDAPPIAPE